METFVILLILLVVGAILAFAFASDFGSPLPEIPTRCPTCKHDRLARSQTPVLGDTRTLYECSHCGATFRDWELR